MPTVSIPPALTFGTRDRHFLAKAFAVAMADRTRFQMGSGTNLYDYVYVQNLVDAELLATKLLLAAHGKHPPAADRRIDGENFHITNYERMPFWTFDKKVAAAAGHPVQEKDIIAIPALLGSLHRHPYPSGSSGPSRVGLGRPT